ncbi:hypothetical protein ACIBG0_34995 [Nocardia sp. NPDC050630]|uniref:hypothetical protein n=1 Tax=Nocardia sp. NPDC050630 TaxID=3364321 RepID=UPI0037A34E3B
MAVALRSVVSNSHVSVGVDPAAPLSADQFVAAIAGHLDPTSPMVGWARELGDLQAMLVPGQLVSPRRPTDADEAAARAEIARVVAMVGSWAMFRFERDPLARKGTHSFGEVVSHVARTYAHAWWAVLHTDQDEPQQLPHEAWFHLGQVREGYADLVEDLRAATSSSRWDGVASTPDDPSTHSPREIRNSTQGFTPLDLAPQ